MELWPEWKLAYHPWTLFRINLEFRNYSWYYFPGRIIVLILYKSLTYFVNKIVERTSKGIFNNHNIHTSFICWRIPKAKKFSQKFACITRLPVSASYEKKKEKHPSKSRNKLAISIGYLGGLHEQLSPETFKPEVNKVPF